MNDYPDFIADGVFEYLDDVTYQFGATEVMVDNVHQNAWESHEQLGEGITITDVPQDIFDYMPTNIISTDIEVDSNAFYDVTFLEKTSCDSLTYFIILFICFIIWRKACRRKDTTTSTTRRTIKERLNITVDQIPDCIVFIDAGYIESYIQEARNVRESARKIFRNEKADNFRNFDILEYQRSLAEFDEFITDMEEALMPFKYSPFATNAIDIENKYVICNLSDELDVLRATLKPLRDVVEAYIEPNYFREKAIKKLMMALLQEEEEVSYGHF